jgi:multisubunit Na+/H+ antiporter MnhB subunit
MADNTPPPARGAGAIIALSIAGGTAIGVAFGQPSLGLIGGLVFGAGVALLLFLLDKRR